MAIYSGAEAGGDGGIYPHQYFRFLQILGRKFRLKAKKPLKLTTIVNDRPNVGHGSAPPGLPINSQVSKMDV